MIPTNALAPATASAVTKGQGDECLESSPPHSTKRQDLATTIGILAELFPALFVTDPRQPHRPLKVGIHLDLIASGVLLPPECKAIGWYCRRTAYQRGLAAGGLRYDLDGNPAGEVKPEEAAGAAKVLEHIRARRAEQRAKEAADFIAARQAARKAVERPKGPVPYHKATPQKASVRPPQPAARLGLADLKRAFQERKQTEGAP